MLRALARSTAAQTVASLSADRRPPQTARSSPFLRRMVSKRKSRPARGRRRSGRAADHPSAPARTAVRESGPLSSRRTSAARTPVRFANPSRRSTPLSGTAASSGKPQPPAMASYSPANSETAQQRMPPVAMPNASTMGLIKSRISRTRTAYSGWIVTIDPSEISFAGRLDDICWFRQHSAPKPETRECESFWRCERSPTLAIYP